MISEKLKQFEELSPGVSSWYAQMYEVRDYLLKIMEELPEDKLDFTPNEKTVETIGTLLLHIAGVEWSWIFEDIDGVEMDFEKFKYGFALRPKVNLPQIKGKSKQFYLDLLNEVRDEVFQRLKRMTDADLKKEIVTETLSYTIEWVLFHLVEHEAMHVGQILLLKRL